MYGSNTDANISKTQHLYSTSTSRIKKLKVFGQKGDLLNFKANIDPMAVLTAEPSQARLI